MLARIAARARRLFPSTSGVRLHRIALLDVFWNAMAVLGLGSIPTIALYPTFCAKLHGTRPEAAPEPAEQPAIGDAV